MVPTPQFVYNMDPPILKIKKYLKQVTGIYLLNSRLHADPALGVRIKS